MRTDGSGGKERSTVGERAGGPGIWNGKKKTHDGMSGDRRPPASVDEYTRCLTA